MEWERWTGKAEECRRTSSRLVLWERLCQTWWWWCSHQCQTQRSGVRRGKLAISFTKPCAYHINLNFNIFFISESSSSAHATLVCKPTTARIMSSAVQTNYKLVQAASTDSSDKLTQISHEGSSLVMAAGPFTQRDQEHAQCPVPLLPAPRPQYQNLCPLLTPHSIFESMWHTGGDPAVTGQTQIKGDRMGIPLRNVKKRSSCDGRPPEEPEKMILKG